MSEPYIPSTEEVREAYVYDPDGPLDEKYLDMDRVDFDRWLDQARREAKVEALKEAASDLRDLDDDGNAVYWDGDSWEFVHYWIDARADQLEQEGKNDE